MEDLKCQRNKVVRGLNGTYEPGERGKKKKKKRLVKEMGQKKITHRPGLTYGVEAGMDRAHSGTGRNGELTV